jgi:hypothetical protein
MIEEWKDIGCKFDRELEIKKNKRSKRFGKVGNGSSYKWYSSLKKQMNTSRPTRWFEEAEANGLLEGNGKCAKRLRNLAKKDRRKLMKVTEKREEVRSQLGKDLWKYGVVGLSQAGKPRGIKKSMSETSA